MKIIHYSLFIIATTSFNSFASKTTFNCNLNDNANFEERPYIKNGKGYTNKSWVSSEDKDFSFTLAEDKASITGSMTFPSDNKCRLDEQILFCHSTDGYYSGNYKLELNRSTLKITIREGDGHRSKGHCEIATKAF